MRVLHLLVCGSIAAAALAGCAKSSNSSSAASSAPSAAAAGPSGASVYASDCASCHQFNGEGSPGAFPPLAGNPVVTGDPVKVIHAVKYGLSGPLQVNGKQYSGTMPAWGSQISDADIAAAITYIRSSWGNHAGPVTAGQVTAVAK
jgi:mono/diheme cytochrome c family protein